MEKVEKIETKKDVLRFLEIALEHEWAVSFEYLIHAYSMPKGKFFYDDPVMKLRMDSRAQTIQIGIDEMYHALQLGTIITQMGGEPSFKTDEVIRFPKIIDNLKRDQMTEDLVTDLYQSAKFKKSFHPKIQNMVLNIAADEIRHSRQFTEMIETMKRQGLEEALCFQPNPINAQKDEVLLLHKITRLENELMHRYLYYVLLFGEHQDLSQRLFKNSINHMRNWDKLSGLLVKCGDVIQVENAKRDPNGRERSLKAMPAVYPGADRLEALKPLVPAEEKLIAAYEKAISLFPDGEIKDQLKLHLALCREHLFTQQWLLKNARTVKGL